MPVALITGIAGQDGTYLARYLIKKGYRLIGIVRDKQKPLEYLTPAQMNNVELVEWDMSDHASIVYLLSRFRPNEIYNFAAYSSGSGMFDSPLEVADINGMAVVRILEAIKEVDASIRFCQASSREVFGEALDSPQSEVTVINPRSPYGAAKSYADFMIRIYRQRYNIFACSAILFNHESPLRGVEFVTRKITSEVAKIRFGLSNELRLGNLNTARDWGFAGDYVRAMWLMLQQAIPDDYVIATGETHTVREFCMIAFSYLGLNYHDYVSEDLSVYRPSEPSLLVGNSLKAREVLNWTPIINFKSLVEMMVEADMEILKQSTEGQVINGKL